jgi:kinesin family protein C2/C3
MSSLQASKDALEQTVASLTSQLQQTETIASETEQQLRIVTENERKLNIAMDDKIEEIAFCQTEIEDMREQQQQADGRRNEELQELQGDVDALNAKLEKTHLENEELKRALTTAPPPPPPSNASDALQIATLTEELEKLKEEHAASKKSSTDLAAVYQKKIKENNELASRLEVAEQKATQQADLSEELSSTKSELNSTKSELTLLKSTAAAFAKQAEKDASLSSSTQAQLDAALKQVETLKSQLAPLEALQKESANAQKDAETIETLKTQIETQAQQLNAQHAETTQQLRSDLERSQREAAAQRAAASTDSKLVESLRSELNGLQPAVDTLTTEKNKLESALNNLTTEKNTLEDAIGVLTGEREGMEGALAAAQEKAARLQQEMDSLGSEADGLRGSEKALADAQEEAAASKAELKLARSTKAKTDAELKAAVESMDDYKSALANLNMENQQVQEVEASLRAEIMQLKDEVLETKAKMKVAKAKMKESSAKQAPSTPTQPTQREVAFAEVSSPLGTPYFSPTLTRSNLNQLVSAPLSQTVIASSVESALQSNEPARLSEALKEVDAKRGELMKANALLLAKIQNGQHNIQVVSRIRPLTEDEAKVAKPVSVETLSSTEVGYFDIKPKDKSGGWKSFAFDKVFGPDQNQQEVFEHVEPLCLSVVDGFNACIFAYGQTGSGKTFTMEGKQEENNWGVSYRALHKIFELLQYKKENGAQAGVSFSYSVTLSVLEIYNDEVKDLITPNSGASMELKRNAEGKISIPNLSSASVMNLDDVMRVLQNANKNRSTASTNLNEDSSRSHMVVSAEVRHSLPNQPESIGTLSLVDLAGSERIFKSAVQGAQLKEAQHINKSLSALADVMEALDKKQQHIPYRNSKLTYFLQDSLGGNSKTLMVVTLSPSSLSSDESLCALQFATRVRKIVVPAAQSNVGNKNLEESMKKLRSELRDVCKTKDRLEEELSLLKKEHSKVQMRLSTLISARSGKENEAKKSQENKLDMFRKNNADLTTRYMKEKTMRESQALQIDKCERELRKVSGLLAKAQKDRDTLSKKVVEREQAMMSMSLGMSLGSTTAVGLGMGLVKPSSNGPAATMGPPKTPKTPKTPTLMAVKREEEVDLGEGEPIVAAAGGVAGIKAAVKALLQKYEPAKIDKLDDLFSKFLGKEAVLLEKMERRYNNFGDSENGGGVAANSRQEAANEKFLLRQSKSRKK